MQQGVNHRLTLAYVTDGALEDFESADPSGNQDYPRTTLQGNTVGWETVSGGYQARNRSNAIDRRLAGHVRNDLVAPFDFRIDLPAPGNYRVRAAMGDAVYAATCGLDLYDGSTSLGTLCSGTTSAAGRFFDATGTELTAAAWPGSNGAVVKTFASTICRFRCTVVSAPLAHVYVETVTAAGVAMPGQFDRCMIPAGWF